MPDVGQLTCSGACLARTQSAVASALRHYTDTPIAKPYYIRGCIPEPDGAGVIVALWTGPTAREKWNLFLLVPLVSDGLAVPAQQVVACLMRLSRGTHLFGSVGRRFDGKPLLDGSRLVEGEGRPCECSAAPESRAPHGFYFERPGELKQYP
ncbi:hypothetical protein OOK31_35975 [Streptomyces sp. NBC_00249]|uniref:hypothetical protein n=1 Tax=Streptomyces sp. NBC_00249 TaxID=2975690 RepID=UPI00224D9980|nr:hypothetical protein [Streptomyces sp. NBC_00249]MCX5199221.1 hypothetical protein [Streptomyces sp. NBC_00249]